MRVMQVYNQYRSMHGGEETVVKMTAELVEKRGGEARLLIRSSRGLDKSLAGKFRAFANGIYSRAAYREMAALLEADRPDVVHAHNLYPLLSPSVLVACGRASVPVVLSTHNYVLTCPTTHHLHKENVCQRCAGGKEHWCVLKNCRQNFWESVAYATRSLVARRLGLYRYGVAIFIVLSAFARRKLVDAGFDADRIVVLPNMVGRERPRANPERGQYVAFSGRMSKEKGIDTLLRAAQRLPDLRVRLAGDGPLLDELRRQAPANAELPGRLDADAMTTFYQNARFLVVPSKCFEGCPLVVSEAMSQGLPIIASRIGGLPELVDDGVTGWLFEPGNAEELAQKIRLLWDDPDLCRRMGRAGREKAQREYSEDVYYERLTAAYARAMELGGRRNGHRGADSYGDARRLAAAASAEVH